MFGVREAVKTKFEIDERLRSERRKAPWWVLEVVGLIGLTVLVLMVLN